MADLTADAPLRFRYPHLLKLTRWVLDSAAARTVYKGQPLFIDADVDTVHPVQYVDAVTMVTANDIVIGIANEGISFAISTTEGKSTEIEVITGGEVGFKSAVFTDANVGDAVGMTDSGTLAAVVKAGTADNIPLGILQKVEDGYAYVELYADLPLHLAF